MPPIFYKNKSLLGYIYVWIHQRSWKTVPQSCSSWNLLWLWVWLWIWVKGPPRSQYAKLVVDSRGAGNASGMSWDTSLCFHCESTREWWELCLYVCVCPNTFFFLTLPEENAERIMLDPTSRENLKFKDLQKVAGNSGHSQETQHLTWQHLIVG